MSIVQLNSNLIGEFEPSTLRLLESADDIVQGCSDPEVLLLQTKLLTTIEVVVGVQDSRDGLCTLLICYRALVITTIELLEIKLSACGLGRPQTQVVRRVSVETWNGDIIGNGLDDFSTLPNCNMLAIVILIFSYASVELNLSN